MLFFLQNYIDYCQNIIYNKTEIEKERRNEMRKFEVVQRLEQKQVTLPYRATRNAAGYDFEALEDTIIPSIHEVKPLEVVFDSLDAPTHYKPGLKPTLVPTGIKALMEDDESLELYNRSSNPKLQLMLANGVGLVDSDYYGNESNDGEIMFPFINIGDKSITIKKGTRIGQGVFRKFLKTDDDIVGRDRVGGFGSTND